MFQFTHEDDETQQAHQESKTRERKELAKCLEEEISALSLDLECPVCLVIPRSAPVFLCRAGHSVCSECFPRLPRNYRSRRCPICQAKYCNPPARNFLAEKLLECVNRNCRFDFQGCDFVCKSSEALLSHEYQCAHKPRDFKFGGSILKTMYADSYMETINKKLNMINNH